MVPKKNGRWHVDYSSLNADCPRDIFPLPRINQIIDETAGNELLLMMPFSIGTGLERVEIVGPELKLSLGRSAGSGRWTPLQKARNKEDRRGFARCLSDA